ncbi:PssD/Cps14F family polysaccharide biosynthesis glycosyltransferase [Enterococcus termitis]|jgi:beta-1,4-N-acetylglucosaminyltransferase|nr:PssD/Cps14F family polysaccharide biosynthesis glycosyltransferase [Enterococcus termitis]
MTKKICFTSSSGGHLEQLLMLKPLMNKYACFIVTEKTAYEVNVSCRSYKLLQINRRELLWFIYLLYNLYLSVKIMVKEKPDVIISTGVLSTIPICLVGKLCRKKIIYIESFAKTTSKTKTGQLMYYIADRFYIQWESLQMLYPKGIYKGGIY